MDVFNNRLDISEERVTQLGISELVDRLGKII